jgi:hypothetical protein
MEHDRIVALWQAVIAQAVRDVLYPELDRPTLEERCDAYDWLRSESAEPQSFLWCCNEAGIEPDAVRRQLRDAGIL